MMRHAALHARVSAIRAPPLARAPAPHSSSGGGGGGGALQSSSTLSVAHWTHGSGAWGRRWFRRGIVTTKASSSTVDDASDPSNESSLQRTHPLPRVLVIAGPTAVGKTSLSLRMAKALGGEIVSADSVQVYKGLDVGSSKLPESEREGIVHHLLDIMHPSEEFGAGEFCEHATAAIDRIVSKGKVPIVVGGTGLYLRWLVGGKPATPPSDPEAAAAAKAAVRAAAEDEKKAEADITAGMSGRSKSKRKNDDDGDDDDGWSSSTGWRGAVKLLAESGDPETAARLAENDWYRVERALEIVMTTGRPVSDFKPTPPPPYDFRCVMLTMPRVPLYRRIDERVETMVRDGILEEAAEMLTQGIPPGGCPAARSIGYRQAMDFLVKLAAETPESPETPSISCTHEELLEFLEETQKATRAFAKRQFTWFRGEKEGLYTWIDARGGGGAGAGAGAGSQSQSQSELDDAVLDVFNRHATGDGDDDEGEFSCNTLIDVGRGEVDKETAQELKRYRAVQKIICAPDVSKMIRLRVNRLAADLAGSIPRDSA